MALPAEIAESILKVPVALIQPARHQARKTFEPTSIERLAESMKQEGLVQPITLRQVAGESSAYELISGERRLRAAKLLGWEYILARILQPASEEEATAKGLVENLQREDLDALEEAEGFSALNKEDPAFWTHDKIAKVTGKGRTYVTQSLGLLSLPESVKAYVRRRTLSRSHALEILPLQPEVQERLSGEIVDRKLSIKQTRNRVSEIVSGSALDKTGDSLLKGDPADPLRPVWEHLKGDPMANLNGGWNVDFSPLGWKFSIPNVPIQKLVFWFKQLSQALEEHMKYRIPVEGTAKASISADPVPDALVKTLRLPSTAGEMSEVEALAPQGPAAVYAWIFGADNFLSWQMRNAHWPPDVSPLDACRALITQLKARIS